MFDHDGFSYKQEPFEDWYRDGTDLFAEHLALVGEPPDSYSRKNLTLFRKLDDLGVMQITTARSNGRLFGYIMAIVTPSFEDEHTQEAMHTTFYASKDAPGIGLKLIRASLDALKARGVRYAVFRAGVRGDGPRLSTLYRRIGAKDFGTLHLLDMEGA